MGLPNSGAMLRAPMDTKQIQVMAAEIYRVLSDGHEGRRFFPKNLGFLQCDRDLRGPKRCVSMKTRPASLAQDWVVARNPTGPFQVHRLRLVKRAERKQDEAETDGYRGNVG